MSGANILYLDSYTHSNGESNASDEIGYGITATEVIKKHLRLLGHNVHDLSAYRIKANSKLDWIQESYSLLRNLSLNDYNVIFIFHIFQQFPCEIRRILLERGYRHIKIIGYTHGSHWDYTDTFREIFYPGMRMTDLANLLSMDGVLVVSHYFRKVLLQSVRSFSTTAASDLERRLIVTGLPINNYLIDRYYTSTKTDKVQIVFNHSPTISKAPELFFGIMEHILPQHDIRLVVTRRFHTDSPGSQQLQYLQKLYGNRVIVGNTMQLAEYYTMLWTSHIQVSTAQHESLGIATLEAMYTHNCCLLPKRQSYPEITDNINLYASDKELLDMLTHYIHNQKECKHMAELMHEKSLQYLPVVIVKRISEAIKYVLSS